MEITPKLLSQFYPLRKALAVGGSYLLTLPKEWIEFYCSEINGEYWFEVVFEGKEVTMKAINKEDIEAMIKTIRVKE